MGRYAASDAAALATQALTAGERADDITRLALREMYRVILREASASLFLVGTDLSRRRPSNLPGFSLHDELTLLVELGLTPAKALQAATYNAARFENQLSDYGTVDKGKRADLVLLNANPLDDIRNTTTVDAVVLNGVLLDRTRLDALLAAGGSAARRQ